ncbi:hypothetical protein [Natronobacterium texcoconense]|uniref:Uncharacterized protein n=1 Tax=Natronobacterium texcoconense TaxID=1095778 RepID=A0A1H1GNX9_NATTX|nr:hypothetical protein [Natronobacterium texcoconense]SDR14793.1 hypothetical protein SAMN04489842_2520 [Natronobacterium texcoconense]
MGARTDAALAVVALGAFVALVLLVDASLSLVYLALGAVGTLAFELLAARDPELVRYYWERPLVQFVSLAIAVGVAAIGARVAPTAVLSLCIGATVAYLVFLALVGAVRRSR